jgi:hypothetical protein
MHDRHVRPIPLARVHPRLAARDDPVAAAGVVRAAQRGRRARRPRVRRAAVAAATRRAVDGARAAGRVRHARRPPNRDDARARRRAHVGARAARGSLTAHGTLP